MDYKEQIQGMIDYSGLSLFKLENVVHINTASLRRYLKGIVNPTEPVRKRIDKAYHDVVSGKLDFEISQEREHKSKDQRSHFDIFTQIEAEDARIIDQIWDIVFELELQYYPSSADFAKTGNKHLLAKIGAHGGHEYFRWRMYGDVVEKKTEKKIETCRKIVIGRRERIEAKLKKREVVYVFETKAGAVR